MLTCMSWRRSLGSTKRVVAQAPLVSGIGVAITGDFQGKIMTDVQPMKMAAAEALYEWNYTAQLLHMRAAEGKESTDQIERESLINADRSGLGERMAKRK